MCLGRGADSRVMSTAHPILGKTRALWGAALPGPSFCGPHSVNLRAVEDQCPPGLWLSETDPDAAGGMIAAQRTSPGGRGCGPAQNDPQTCPSQSRTAGQAGCASVSSSHPASPLPGAPGCDAVPNHRPWDRPPEVRGSPGSSATMYGLVLYLACEKGSVEGGLRGRARQHHCASCPGPGVSTARPDPGLLRPHFTGGDTEAAPRESR